MRREEFKRNQRWDALLFGAMLLYIFGLPMWESFKEGRFYRDMAGITPFSDVTAEATPVVDGIYLGGTLKKERCKFAGLVGYITTKEGDKTTRFRVLVDVSPEEGLTGVSSNRPVSGKAETWGPWKLWYDGSRGRPVYWEAYAQHIPLDPSNADSTHCYQNNLFAEGKWDTKGIAQWEK